MPPKEIAPLLWAMVSDKEAKELAPYKAYVYATDVKGRPGGVSNASKKMDTD